MDSSMEESFMNSLTNEALLENALSENERLRTAIIEIKEVYEETIDLLSSYKSPLSPLANNGIDSLKNKFNEIIRELDNETN